MHCGTDGTSRSCTRYRFDFRSGGGTVGQKRALPLHRQERGLATHPTVLSVVHFVLMPSYWVLQIIIKQMPWILPWWLGFLVLYCISSQQLKSTCIAMQSCHFLSDRPTKFVDQTTTKISTTMTILNLSKPVESSILRYSRAKRY